MLSYIVKKAIVRQISIRYDYECESVAQNYFEWHHQCVEHALFQQFSSRSYCVRNRNEQKAFICKLFEPIK